MSDETTAADQDREEDPAVTDSDPTPSDTEEPAATDPSDPQPRPDNVEDNPTAAGTTDAPQDAADRADNLESDDPTDLIDPTEGTAAGGTALADAVHGADAVDEALGDDATPRPERGDQPPPADEDLAEEATDRRRAEAERFARAADSAFGPREQPSLEEQRAAQEGQAPPPPPGEGIDAPAGTPLTEQTPARHDIQHADNGADST